MSWFRTVFWGRRGGTRSHLRHQLWELFFPQTPEPVAEPSAPPGYSVIGDDDLKEGEVKEVFFGGRCFAVARSGGQLYAVDGICPHAGGALGEGTIQDGAVVCPMHGWCFRLHDGTSLTAPGHDLGTLDVISHGGRLCARPKAPSG